MLFIVVLALAVFFALNMGGASFAASFATSFGGRIVTKKRAGLLFLIFVVIGALTIGDRVSNTLGRDIVLPEFIDLKALLVIFLSAGLSMTVSNLMKIPQSTSIVTVAAIAGVGFYHGHIQVDTILRFLKFWIVLPVLSYFLTYWLAGWVYPPRKRNFWIYEKFINHQGKLKLFVILSSCYNAYSVGTNNVANVVGPLMANMNYSIILLLLVFAVAYGLGAFVFSEPLKTASDRFVPLGLTTAAIISIVSGSLMLVASVYGVPQSFVMLQLGAIFAVSSLKHSHEMTFSNPMTIRTLYTWTVNPIITFFISLALMYVIY